MMSTFRSLLLRDPLSTLPALLDADRDSGALSLSADLAEDANGVQIRLDVPGIDPERIQVEQVDGHLRVAIKGEGEEGRDSSFALPLPRDANPDGLKATCRWGRLTIEVPRQTPPTRVIPVVAT